MTKKELQDIIRWDIQNWKGVLPYWEQSLPKNRPLKAAAFGEREGGLALWLAQKGIEVNCSDYNDELENAKKLHAEYNVSDLIDYSQQDIRKTTFEDQSFDIVIFKSVVGSIGEEQGQKEAFQELYRILKPGGILLFAENLTSSKLHQFARKKFTGWGNRWRYITLSEIDEWTKDFTKKDFQSNGFLAAFGRSEGQRNFLGKMDAGVSKITPKSWHYILMGVCVK